MTNSDKRLRVAWVGCGNHATDNLLPYLRHTRANLVATCDVDKERAARAAQCFGAQRVYSDYRTLLAHEEIDALMVAVGPQLHFDISMAALEAQRHVFVEKPPSATVAQAVELAQKAEETGLQVMTGFMKRFATVNLMAREVVTSEGFGRPLSLVSQYMTAPGYFNDRTGFLHHHCVHYADLVQHLLGDVTEVQTRQLAFGATQLLYHINLQFASGALGFLQMGTIQSRGNPVEWLQIMSDGHRVEVNNVNRITYYRPNDQKWPYTAANLDFNSDALTWEPNLTVAINQDHKGYANELMHFVECVLTDQAPRPGPLESVKAMRLLKAIAESADAGETVAV